MAYISVTSAGWFTHSIQTQNFQRLQDFLLLVTWGLLSHIGDTPPCADITCGIPLSHRKGARLRKQSKWTTLKFHINLPRFLIIFNRSCRRQVSAFKILPLPSLYINCQNAELRLCQISVLDVAKLPCTHVSNFRKYLFVQRLWKFMWLLPILSSAQAIFPWREVPLTKFGAALCANVHVGHTSRATTSRILDVLHDLYSK